MVHGHESRGEERTRGRDVLPVREYGSIGTHTWGGSHGGKEDLL